MSISPNVDELARGGIDDLFMRVTLLVVNSSVVNLKLVQYILKFTSNGNIDKILGYTLVRGMLEPYKADTA